MQHSNPQEPEYIEYIEEKVEVSSLSTNAFNDEEEDCVDQCSFMHADMRPENKIIVTLGQYDPRTPYLTVYPGLNIKGTCKPKAGTCIAEGKNVWIKKGYGTFNIAKIRCGNVCPCCQTKMAVNSFTTLGYRNARVQFVGSKTINGEEEDFSFMDEERQGKFIKFKDTIDSQCYWDFLEAKVSEIKQ